MLVCFVYNVFFCSTMEYTYYPTIIQIGTEHWKSFSTECAHQLAVARQALEMLRQREAKLRRAYIQLLMADQANVAYIEWLGIRCLRGKLNKELSNEKIKSKL